MKGMALSQYQAVLDVESFHPLVVPLVNHLMPLVGVFLGCYGMDRGLECVSHLHLISTVLPSRIPALESGSEIEGICVVRTLS
jgi:hypothetical protein